MSEARTPPAQEDFNYYSEEQMQNPYPMYEEFRERCPVGRSEHYGGFAFVSRYDDAKRVFSDFQTFTSSNGIGLPGRPIKLYPVDLDPPEQTKFRRILNRHYTPEAAEAARPMVEKLVSGLIDDFIETGSADLADDLVRKTLPPTVLPIIGVPLNDLAVFSDWVDKTTRRRVSNPEGVVEAAHAMLEYLIGVVAERRKVATPPDDTLQSLIDADFKGQKLGDEDIARTLMIIINGGLDTTTVAVLESLLHLSRNPALAEGLRSGEYPWGPAVEELIRYYSPVTVMGRTVVKDVDLSGVQLKAGEYIHTMPGAANRDPRRFADADKCILDRADNDHLSFGNGAHICLGRNIARMEIQTICRQVIERMPDFRTAPDFVPEFEAFQGRAMKHLPVSFTPGKRLG